MNHPTGPYEIKLSPLNSELMGNFIYNYIFSKLLQIFQNYFSVNSIFSLLEWIQKRKKTKGKKTNPSAIMPEQT